ncbi:hypothetical protein ACSFA8_22350 [Variovorax sp. RT4R15]|uniref:hypothetical protein n=1 Tax=Variovorax sp. RT4R15 TaxID=3443737 RepID=UPI003F465F01
MMHDPLPLPRLSISQLRALAKSVRHQAGANDPTADSVAAALESVSRRRTARQPLLLARRAFTGLQRRLLQLADASVDFAHVCLAARALQVAAYGEQNASRYLSSQAAQRRAPASTPGSKVMSLSPSVVKQAFLAVENGNGLSPDLCNALVELGWLEWVDFVHGTPIDANSPRSLLRMTREGRRLFRTERVSLDAGRGSANSLAA